jgi:hypothetical protein
MVHKDLVLQDHYERFGDHPKAYTADKNYYRDMKDVSYWEQRIDTFSFGKKGRRDAAETARGTANRSGPPRDSVRVSKGAFQS